MIKATVTVPGNMSEETYNLLISGVKEKYTEEITFKKLIDDSLLGGFILSVDGTIYDNSIKTQLKNIKKHIVNR